MTAVTMETLTVEQKKAVARELRPTSTIRELSELLGVGTKAIWNWTKDLRVDLRPRRKPDPITEWCECAAPFGDARLDKWCKRRPTCLICTRPERRS